MNLRKNRFGPNVLSWTSCRTRRDFMVHGSLQAGGYYIVSGGTLLIWSLFHKSNFLSFVRIPPPIPLPHTNQTLSQKKVALDPILPLSFHRIHSPLLLHHHHLFFLGGRSFDVDITLQQGDIPPHPLPPPSFPHPQYHPRSSRSPLFPSFTRTRSKN